MDRIGNTRSLSAAARTCLLAWALLGVSGCVGFGPVSVDRDRFDYVQAIADSWKQQTFQRGRTSLTGECGLFWQQAKLENGRILKRSVWMKTIRARDEGDRREAPRPKEVQIRGIA